MVPLDDGSEITIGGTTATGDEVRIWHGQNEHGSWQVSWASTDGQYELIYDSDSQDKPYEQDTADALEAVTARANQHNQRP